MILTVVFLVELDVAVVVLLLTGLPVERERGLLVAGG